MMIDTLYQQRPVGLGQARQTSRLERAVLDMPATTSPVLDQPRLDIVALGQLCQHLKISRCADITQGTTDQQGLLVPVITQEFAGGQAAQQGKGFIHHIRCFARQ